MGALPKTTGRFRSAIDFFGYGASDEEVDEFDTEIETEAEPIQFDLPKSSTESHANVSALPTKHTPQPVADLRRIVTVCPSNYNQAKEIGEAFREGVPVIMNLTNLADSEARRMVDFAAGLIFGLQGSIEKVTSRVFLLTPKTVKVSVSEDKDQNNQWF